MYRGINGTPSALLPEPPLPPSTASPPTTSLLSLSLSLLLSLALPSALYSSLPFSYHGPQAVFRIPSLFRFVLSPTIVSLSPFLCLSIICIRAHVYHSVFLPVAGSRSPSYDLPRSTATFVFASAQHTSQIGSRATLYPNTGVYSRTKHRGEGERVACALDRGMQRVAEMRTYTELVALSLVRSAPLCPFVSLYRLSWSSVHASRRTPVDTSSLCYLDTP